MANKTISCGVIITDGSSVLIARPTGETRYNIPKGMVDPGESFLQTAVRELEEETGLTVDPAELSPLGKFAYRPDKDLVLYLYRVETMPDENSLHCRSTFTDKRTGRQLPELDKFAVVDWSTAIRMVNPSLQPVMSRIHKEISHA